MHPCFSRIDPGPAGDNHGNSCGVRPSMAEEQQPKQNDNKMPVTVTLKISDRPSGLTLDAKKAVAAGSNGFDVLRAMVNVSYKNFSQIGPFVTGLCGVDAPDGVFWALYVDGCFSKVGIGDVTISKDTLIEWKTQNTEK